MLTFFWNPSLYFYAYKSIFDRICRYFQDFIYIYIYIHTHTHTHTYTQHMYVHKYHVIPLSHKHEDFWLYDITFVFKINIHVHFVLKKLCLYCSNTISKNLNSIFTLKVPYITLENNKNGDDIVFSINIFNKTNYLDHQIIKKLQCNLQNSRWILASKIKTNSRISS